MSSPKSPSQAGPSNRPRCSHSGGVWVFLAASLVVPGNAAHYPGTQATPWGSAFPQSFPGNTRQAYLFPGLAASVLQSSGPPRGTCIMLVPRERKDERAPTLRPLIPLVLGRPGIGACPHWANTSSFKAVAPKAPPPGSLPCFPSWHPGHRSLPPAQPCSTV